MGVIDPEVALASFYALFLLGAAGVLDLLARHSHRRSERYRTAGFRYHAHLDAWECPEGQHLWPHEHDRELRLVRYRAKAHVCNACAAKPGCTDSDDGRELVRSLESWARSEAGRFHRVLSVTLVLLAVLILAVVLVRHHEPAELAALGSLLALAAVVCAQLAPALLPERAAGGSRRAGRADAAT